MSLRKCLKKMGLSRHEAAIMRAITREHHTGDRTHIEAAKSAVGQRLKELRAERESVNKQVEEALRVGTGERSNPVQAETADHVAIAAQRAAELPTPAQIEAGVNRKGRFQFAEGHPLHGLGVIAIETAKGIPRVHARGEWQSPPMPAHYGHLENAAGADGDKADITVGDHVDAKNAYVIDQINPQTEKFDETKSFVGFPSKKAAVAAYLGSFSDDAKPRIGAVTEMPNAQFVQRARANNLHGPVAYEEPEKEMQVPTDTHDILRKMAESAVWFEEGGRAMGGNETAQVYVGGKAIGPAGRSQSEMNEAGEGRTHWIGMPDWARGFGMNREDITKAVNKAIDGKALGKKQKAVVEAMLAEIAELRAISDEVGDKPAKAWQDEIVAEIASSPMPEAWNTMTEEERNAELDAIFGPQKSATQGGEVRASGPQEEVGPAGEEREPGSDDEEVARPALALEQPTEAALAAKQAQAETGNVEERHAAVRDRNEAILSAPEGTAPPASVAEAKVPTQQPNLFAARGKTTPKAPTPPSRQASPSSEIADFGEKIGGARKDVWQAMKDNLIEAQRLDVVTEPLSKSWPEPDYQALLDDGADPWAVGFMHAARDAVPPKPRMVYKVQRWAETVKQLRDATVGLADGTLSVDRAKTLLSELASKSRGMDDIASRIELYEMVGHSKSLAGVRVSVGSYGVFEGREYNPPKVIWSVEKQAAATAFGNWPRMLATGATKAEAMRNFKERFATLMSEPAAKRETTFEIYSKRGENGYWVGKKIGRNSTLLEGPFKTVKEARAYKDTHQAELLAKLEKVKEIPNERRDTNEPRVGEDMRQGQDVAPQMFSDTFGFRGVEFGNWVEHGKRQQDLNDAFDALMDMAAVLNVPPKALSLNGELGLAFGARGTGGLRPAKAHYEPGHVVINLTKKAGAGSLGHEWWHALDNYFSRMRGKGADMMTSGLDVSLAARGSKYEHAGAVRKEMIEAYGAVMRAIRETALKARSAKLDAKRTSEYWTTSPEMSARAYESYLISKLQDQGASNDYLANIVDEQTWRAAEKLGWQLDDSYPYPTAGEIPAIRAAFDHFFETVQTKETDKGTAMFSRSTGEEATSHDAITKAIAPVLAQWKNAPEVSIINSMDEAPQAVKLTYMRQQEGGAVGAPEAFIYRDKVYLVADGLSSPEAATRALLHESVGHFGLRQTFGERLDPILDEVAKSLPNKMKAKAREYGLNLADASERRQAAEEVLAQMSQEMPHLGVVKKLIAAIRQFLRDIGVHLNLSDNDIIANYILPARALVERGQFTKMVEAPAFSRMSDAIETARQTNYKQLATGFVDRLDQALNPLGTLPEQEKYLIRRYEAQGTIEKADEAAKAIREALPAASEADQAALFDYLTTAGANSGSIVDPVTRHSAEQIKADINRVGDELVAHGLLSEESRAQYRDAYLPRLYLKHLLSESDWKALGAGKKPSDMGYLKARKDIPEDVRKVILGEVRDPGFLAAVAVAKPMRDMALLDWLSDISQNEKWILPGTMVDFTSPLTGKSQKATPYYFKNEAVRLRKQARYYAPEEAQKAEREAKAMDQAADDALEDVQGTHENYKQIPNTARYGRLRGMLVRSEIYDDLMGVQDFLPTDPGWFQNVFGYGGVGTKATQIWKAMKVSMNPPAQIRNFVSNGIAMQLFAGVPLRLLPARVIQATRDVLDNGKYFQIAKRYGIGASTFATQEVYRMKTELLDLEMKTRGMGPLGRLHRLAGLVMNKAGDFYQTSETIFKTATIIDAMERQGMSEQQAVLLANKALFDYSLVQKSLRYARSAPIGVPFATYAIKVLPRLVETALHHPERFIPWVGLFYGFPMMVAAMLHVDKDDLDKLKKAMPQWLQDKGHALILPYKDEQGRWQVIDLGYFMPWTNWTELGGNIASGELGKAVQGAGIFGGPLTDIITAIKTGKDPFTGKDILAKGDPPERQAVSLLNYVWDMAMPPIITDRGLVSPMGLLDKAYGGKLEQALSGTTNKFGEPRATAAQALLYAAGVNVNALTPEYTRATNLQAMQRDMQNVKTQMVQKLYDRSLTDEQRRDIAKEYATELIRRTEKMKKYMRESEIAPALAAQR